MRLAGLFLALSLLFSSPALAQEPPPRIPPLVIDVHASIPRFPDDDPQLAASHGLSTAQLPGRGLGLQASAHLYFLRIKVITFGVGAEVAVARSSQTPDPASTTLAATEERLSTFSPQLSFNFGNGHGWSYLSGGLGASNWSIVPVGAEKGPADLERIKTLNYGGGARWFAKKHLAFSLDVRIYTLSPGTPYFPPALGSPRTNLLIIGAGISVK